MATIQIADKPTLDTVKTNTETTNTKIGNTADSGASASTGSVNGKLNKIITDASTNMGYVMAGENVTGSISTSSFIVTASSITRKKVGSFTLAHAGTATVVISASWSARTGGERYFFISTTNTTSPTASTESGALATTNKISANTNQGANQYFTCNILNVTARTYYVYAVYNNSNTSTPTWTINSIEASVTYATSTPCQSYVKSVQRGLFEGSSANGNEISINTVAPHKCLVNITPLYSYGGDSSYVGLIGAVLLANKLILLADDTYSPFCATAIRGDVVWEIIEFY